MKDIIIIHALKVGTTKMILSFTPIYNTITIIMIVRTPFDIIDG